MIAFDVTEKVTLPSFDLKMTRRWLEEVARLHGKVVGNLSYLFCNDEEILETNRKYLNHDYFTDIITFDYSRNSMISGDMIISLDTVRSNAEGLGEVFFRELNRVIIHGLLHLCGIDDKGPGEREVMEQHENEALARLDEMIKAKG